MTTIMMFSGVLDKCLDISVLLRMMFVVYPMVVISSLSTYTEVYIACISWFCIITD